jgi:hypothetical protein
MAAVMDAFERKGSPRCLMRMVKAIRVRVRNPPKVFVCAARIILFCRQSLQGMGSRSRLTKVPPYLSVLQGMHTATIFRYKSRLDILGCFALLNAIRSGENHRYRTFHDVDL